MSWEVFARENYGRMKTISLTRMKTISLTKTGVFYLSTMLLDALRNPDRVNLLIDRDRRLIAFEGDSNGAHKVSRGYVSVLSLVREFGQYGKTWRRGVQLIDGHFAIKIPVEESA